MRALLAALLSPLAACATVAADGELADSCKAELGQRFIGQKATAEVGAEIMGATRSSKLRWLAPNSVVTMEYAFGRVNVAYDDSMTITAVRCG